MYDSYAETAKQSFQLFYHTLETSQPHFEIKITSFAPLTFILYMSTDHRQKDPPCLHHSAFEGVLSKP